MKDMKNLLLILIGLIVAGYLALVSVYALPTKPIQNNVLKAANILQADGSHPELIYGHQDTMLDNLTDSIMMNTARFEKEDSIFQEALLNKRIAASGLMDSDILAREAAGEELEEGVISYGRYWHGYLLYLKPLLLLFDYGQIRYFVGCIQFGAFVYVFYLFIKKKKESHILPFAAAYFFLNPAALSLSLQYFPASVLTLLQFVILLLQEEKYKGNLKRWIYHFFIAGCLIAYFDFLTFPLLTLGMPLVFLLVENKRSLKDTVLSFLGSCTAWGAGYGMMWASKWILATLFTEENIIMDALSNVLLRVGAAESEVKVNFLKVVLKNIGANKLCLLIVTLVFVGMIFYGTRDKHRIDFKKVDVGVFLCAILPFLWYLVVSNHSYIHYWFTYRILAISIYAILLGVAKLFEQKIKEEEIK